jgi:hypothetical protein
MRFFACLSVLALVAVSGCGHTTMQAAPPAEPVVPKAKAEFEKLHKEYTARLGEKMASVAARNLSPSDIRSEALQTWDAVFGAHQDVLRAYAAELLNQLDAAPAIQEDLYAVCMDVRPGFDIPDPMESGAFMKPVFWNPLNTANEEMSLVFTSLPNKDQASILAKAVSWAQPALEAVDRNVARPKLMVREGPLVFLIDLSRKEDSYYEVDRVRWLRLRSAPRFAGVALCTNNAGAIVPGGPKFFGLDLGKEARKIVFVMDRSGSMTDSIDYIKYELKRSIGELPKEDEFHVIFYSSGPPVEMPIRRLVPALENNKKLAFEFIDSVIPQGETDPSKAIERAFAAGPDKDTICILTDGEFDHAIVDLVRRLNAERKVRVHTLCFLYKMGEAVLKEIARENGGTYTFVSEKDLAELVQ